MRHVFVLGLVVGCGGHPGAATVDGAPDGHAPNGMPIDANAIEHTIRVTLNNRPDHPDAYGFMVAFRDGDGAWLPAGPSNGDTYSFEAYSSRWSVAWACNGADTEDKFIPQVTIASFTVSERTAVTMDVPTRCTDRMPGVLQIGGTIANAPAGSGSLYLNLLDQYTGAGGNTYTLRARLGVHDLVLRKIDQVTEKSTFSTTSTFIERDLSVATTQHDLDLAAAAPPRTFDVSVPPNTSARATTLLYTKSGTTVTLGRTTSPLETFALDAAQVSPTDVYEQQIELYGLGQTIVTSIASQTPGPLQIQPPAALGSATTAVVAESPYPILQTSWPTYPDAIGYGWVATQQKPPPDVCGGPACTPITWTVFLSPGVVGGSPEYRMPDLTSVPGWNPVFALRDGFEIDGYAEAVLSSAGASDFPPVTPPPAGTQRTYVRSDFTVTP